MSRINIENTHKNIKVSKPFAEKLVLKALGYIKKPLSTEIDIIFLNDLDMRKMNRRYKNSDRYTDVLSFRIERGEFGLKGFLGEIFISLDRAKKQAGIFGNSIEKEVALYIIHGILHLFGYRDEGRGERERMALKENEVLEYLCRKENLSRVLTRR
jgi:probable rRNA maturation factor